MQTKYFHQRALVFRSMSNEKLGDSIDLCKAKVVLHTKKKKKSEFLNLKAFNKSKKCLHPTQHNTEHNYSKNIKAAAGCLTLRQKLSILVISVFSYFQPAVADLSRCPILMTGLCSFFILTLVEHRRADECSRLCREAVASLFSRREKAAAGSLSSAPTLHLESHFVASGSIHLSDGISQMWAGSRIKEHLLCFNNIPLEMRDQ